MSKKSKKLKETKLYQFLLGKTGVLSKLADTVTDQGIFGVIKDLVTDDPKLAQEDKDIALKMLEMDIAEMDAVTQRWKSDMMSDSILSKNIRPLILIFFTLVYATGFFLEYELDLITNLMLLLFGAYFGGRSFEKVNKL